MGRAKTGEAISAMRRTRTARKKLRRFIEAAEKRGDLDCWRRGRAVLGYIETRRVIDLATEAGVTRGSVNRWLQWYEALGIDGLLTGLRPGAPPRLSDAQRAELTSVVEGGPLAAGYQSGVWTGPMIGDLIEQRFGVRYHAHYVPELLLLPDRRRARRGARLHVRDLQGLPRDDRPACRARAEPARSDRGNRRAASRRNHLRGGRPGCLAS